MSKTEKAYRPLPGRGLKKGSFISFHRTRAKLYAGKDHLLSVYNSVYEEEYKRFYYKDIQAFVIRKTPLRDVWALIFFLFVIFFFFKSTGVENGWKIFYGSGLALFAGMFLVNLLRGATSVCYLQTATSQEELPSLCRLKNAFKVIEMLKPLIQKAQGEMSRAEIADKAKVLAAESRNNRSVPLRRTEQQKTEYSGKFHMILFCLFTANGFLMALHIIFHPVVMVIIESILSLLLMVAVILSLITQYDSVLPKQIRVLTWCALGFEALEYFLGVILSQLYIIENKIAFIQTKDILKWISSLSPQENSIVLGYLIFSALVSLLLAALGFLSLSHFKTHGTPASTPTGTEQNQGQSAAASAK